MKPKKRKPWYYRVMLLVSYAICIWAELKIPHGHWANGSLIRLGPPLLAALLTTLYLRALGLSQEARPELVWLNVRRLMAEPPSVKAAEIKHPPLAKWLLLALGALPLAIVLWMRFSMPAGRRADGILAELAEPALFLLAGVLAWLFLSRPLMRVSSDGLSGRLGRAVPWEKIATCRIQTKRNAWGEVSGPKASVRGHDGRALATFNLADTSASQRRAFLLALHQALQPHEAPPTVALDQVLDGTDG